MSIQKSAYNTWSNTVFYLYFGLFLLGNILFSNGECNLLHILQACKVASFNKNLQGFSLFHYD